MRGAGRNWEKFAMTDNARNLIIFSVETESMHRAVFTQTMLITVSRLNFEYHLPSMRLYLKIHYRNSIFQLQNPRTILIEHVIKSCRG
jgi:hypothetical protein